MKVKDFAKALKTEPSVLLERMQSAGLSHKSESDEITPSDKQALLLFLKDRKSGPKKVVTTSDGDIKAKPKPSATMTGSQGMPPRRRRRATSMAMDYLLANR